MKTTATASCVKITAGPASFIEESLQEAVNEANAKLKENAHAIASEAAGDRYEVAFSVSDVNVSHTVSAAHTPQMFVISVVATATVTVEVRYVYEDEY